MGNNKFGVDEQKFEATPEIKSETLKPSELNPGNEALYSVYSLIDGSLEIRIGQELLIFQGLNKNPIWPEKYKNGVPQSVIDHPDFSSHKKFFNVVKKEGV